jgi:hypothetical protein
MLFIFMAHSAAGSAARSHVDLEVHLIALVPLRLPPELYCGGALSIFARAVRCFASSARDSSKLHRFSLLLILRIEG